jgi:DNA-binding GntR family transcriptional regulator
VSLEGVFLPSRDNGRTLADRAYCQIHDAIVSGRLMPGYRLPIEGLAERLDMSPMTIREALRKLHGVGLVENVPHRGAAVTELSLGDLRSLYEARLALEPLAISCAAERRTEDDLGRIRDAYAALEASGRQDPGSGWSAHREFHFAIYAAAHSEWLIRLITPVWESSGRYRGATQVRWSLVRRAHEHQAMLEAITAGDAPAAADLLHDHLAVTANEVAAEMGEGPLFELLQPPAPAL